MSKIALTQAIVSQSECLEGKRRLDIFDIKTKGLVLEVRRSGGKTYYLRYLDDRGRSRQIKLADARDVTLGQARSLADSVRNDIAMGIDPHQEKATAKTIPTVEQFFYQQYLVYAKGYKKSWKTDECLFRNHIQPRLGNKHLDEVRKHDVITMFHQHKSNGGAAGSANRLVILFRYMFNLAIKWETPGANTNPASGVALFDDPPTKERYLSTDEAQRLYGAVTNSASPMLKYIVPMLILTGARRREVLDAQWNDFDFDTMMWRIPMTKSGKPRHIPLSDGVIRLLRSIPKTNSSYVFANPNTLKPYTSIFNPWSTARHNAGLDDVRLHDLRHSFASFLVNNGRSLYEVQKLLGHSQIKTTQRYAHLSQDTLREAASVAMGSIVFNDSVTPSSKIRSLIE